MRENLPKLLPSVLSFQLFEAVILTILFPLFIFVPPASGGPPFNTDDPEPVPYRHWEF